MTAGSRTGDGMGADRPRGRLTGDAIVDAALILIDHDGIERLTMRRLGSELGVDPMMIYRHFPNKAAVLDGVMQRIWESVEIDHGSDELPWEEQPLRVMHGLRSALLQHPRAISIIGTR
ncbi:MAG: TetR/AcrR family transcriptional regulator, partial [Cumulibacter sp.]